MSRQKQGRAAPAARASEGLARRALEPTLERTEQPSGSGRVPSALAPSDAQEPETGQNGTRFALLVFGIPLAIFIILAFLMQD